MKRIDIMQPQGVLTGREVFFDDDDIIVSKTDLTGRITYANDVFLDIAGFREREVIGQPHNILRHPDMPRAVFKLLWEHIREKREIFAYIVNRTKNGDHYWVIAHVTPSLSQSGETVGYHSNRRTPDRATLENVIIPLYRELRTIENRAQDRKRGLEASYARLREAIEAKASSYDAYVHTLAA